MFVHETKIRVRYGETDQMGFVYYGNYAQYYEIGRVEAIRHLGIPYRSMEEKGILLPVLEVKAKYIAAATYDELLTVKSIINELPNRTITFNVEIYNERQKHIHSAEVRLIFLNAETKRPIKAPQALIDKLKNYIES